MVLFLRILIININTEGVRRTFQTGQGIYDNNFKRTQYKFGTSIYIIFIKV